jgi:hypothetical protein
MNEAETLYKMYKTMGELPIGTHIGISYLGKQMSYIVKEKELIITYVDGTVLTYTEQ